MDAIGLLALIAVFQIKHFLADYIWQGRYMLGKFKDSGWCKPLSAHCGVHFAMTFLIVIYHLPIEWAIGLAVLDFMIHFTVDRVKVVVSKGYDSSKDKEFWWCLGADQMAHHFTHYALALLIFIRVNS